ncbi:MAG: hypothetical protein IPN62_07425 [Flavobacteriales bacterium]|nr:hypothetical protein [Flavobacteriales bacterium]
MNFRSFLPFVAQLPVIAGFGQNLVSNPGFEEYSSCPTTYNQVERAVGWFRSTNGNDPEFHTEYLHACNSGIFSSPNNTWGYQEPLSGEGYMVLNTMSPEIFQNYRENIYTQLIAPTQIGVEYTVRVSISHTDNSQIATNNFGIKLSTNTDFPIDNNCQLALADVVMNKTGWSSVTATFIADQAYTHLAIGNFMTDDNTMVIEACSSCPYDLFGYYVDDVCLVPANTDLCSSCKERFNPTLGLVTAAPEVLTLSPTLLGTAIQDLEISLPNNLIRSIEVFDAGGRSVLSSRYRNRSSVRISTTDLANGSYSIAVVSEDATKLPGRFVVAR